MHSAGATIYGEMKFFENIRVGNPSFLPTYVRTVARHEGGHGIGLDNALNCPEGSTIMNPSNTSETFITPCDNNAINNETAYPAPTPTPEGCQLNCGPDSIPDYQNCICWYVGDQSPIL